MCAQGQADSRECTTKDRGSAINNGQLLGPLLQGHVRVKGPAAGAMAWVAERPQTIAPLLPRVQARAVRCTRSPVAVLSGIGGAKHTALARREHAHGTHAMRATVPQLRVEDLVRRRIWADAPVADNTVVLRKEAVWGAVTGPAAGQQPGQAARVRISADEGRSRLNANAFTSKSYQRKTKKQG